MRYPWVCLTVLGVWLATFIVIYFKVVDGTTIFLYASTTSLVLFFLGFTRS